ncbi:MAG: patatin-like phospholipase family protein [Gemmatimonadota bacterium]
MNAPRVVLVLSGGGAKAAAHLGAARALYEAGIRPVHFVGTSMGGVIAVALASGEEPAAILDRFARVKQHDVIAPERLQLFKGIWARALLKTGPLREAIRRIIPVQRFAELTTPVTVTATEVKSGREVAFGTGGEDAPILDVLVATCALPPYFAAAPVNGREFYDGGLRAVVPLRQARSIACDFVIAIHVGPAFDEQGAPVQVPPPFVAAADTAIGWLMAGSTELMREHWELDPGAPPLIWLRPISDRAATFAMEKIPEYAEAGYLSMQKALADLQEGA